MIDNDSFWYAVNSGFAQITSVKRKGIDENGREEGPNYRRLVYLPRSLLDRRRRAGSSMITIRIL